MTINALGMDIPLQLPELLTAMVALRSEVLAEGETLLNVWRPRIQRDAFHQAGARNLALYLALRRRDLRPLQRTLGRWGLSSLGRSESHVQPALDAVVALLEAACRVNGPDVCPFPTEESFFHGAQTIAQEAEAIFGPGGHGRDTRIMVTLPPEAAQDATFATEIMRHGAECVRINCAHDTPAIWEAMLANSPRRRRSAPATVCGC
jgi:pyruvate kinase